MSNAKVKQTSSAENVLRVLLLLHERPAARVKDVSTLLRVAPSTAHRLLSALTNQGIAVQHDDQSYGISPAYLRRLGARTHLTNLTEAMHAALVWLRELTGESAHVMVLRNERVQVLDSVESTKPLRDGSRKGQFFPAHRTATGRILLRARSMEELRRIYPDGPPTDTGFGVDQIDSFWQALQSWHEDYDFTLGGAERGIAGVAMPLHDPAGNVIAGLSVTGPTVRIDRQRVRRIVDSIRQVVTDLEARMSDS